MRDDSATINFYFDTSVQANESDVAKKYIFNK